MTKNFKVLNIGKIILIFVKLKTWLMVISLKEMSHIL